MAVTRLLWRTAVVAPLLALAGWCLAAEPAEHAEAASKTEPADKAGHQVEPAAPAENHGKVDKAAKSDKGGDAGGDKREQAASPAKFEKAAKGRPAESADKAEKSDPAERAAADAKSVPSPARPLPHGPQDPMDMLREKLAAKLGKAKTTEPDPSMLRVTTVASPAEAAAAAREASVARARRKAAPSTTAAHAAPLPPLPWDYGDGPAGPPAWAHLKPEYAQCASGARQSPIDVQGGIKVELDPIQFDYQPSAFRVLDTGRSVQVNIAPGSAIEVMGRRYELVHFDFQRPAEERIDGRQFELGIHLVHRDAEGHLAIVALVANPGDAQPIVQSVWNNLPLEKDTEVAARAPLALNELLPASRGYYTYMGSLTTPPCSEGVLWMVMKQPLQVSADQIAILARLYPMNARPLQAASGRLIKESF